MTMRVSDGAVIKRVVVRLTGWQTVLLVEERCCLIGGVCKHDHVFKRGIGDGKRAVICTRVSTVWRLL